MELSCDALLPGANPTAARTSTFQPSSSRPPHRRIFRPDQDQLRPGRHRSGAQPPRPRCLMPTARARHGTSAQAPAQTAPILPDQIASTATPRAQPSHNTLPCARALVPRPRLVPVAHILLCSCVQLSRSALLFLLYISHPHIPHPLQGAGRGPTPLRPTTFVAAAVNAVVFSPTKAAGAWAGGRGRWRGGAQGWG